MKKGLHWKNLLCGMGAMVISVHVTAQSPFGEKQPMQGCVKQVYEVVYKAVAENGVIGKGEMLSAPGDTSYLYPDNNGLLLRTEDQEPIEPQDSVACQYDTFGRCVKMTVYYPNKELRESRTLVYNGQGKLKLCIVRSTQDEVVDAISYTYDPYGKLAIKIYNRKDGDMRQQRFAYDKKGNWIVRVDFKEYDPVYYVERHIEYYPD